MLTFAIMMTLTQLSSSPGITPPKSHVKSSSQTNSGLEAREAHWESETHLCAVEPETWQILLSPVSAHVCFSPTTHAKMRAEGRSERVVPLVSALFEEKERLRVREQAREKLSLRGASQDPDVSASGQRTSLAPSLPTTPRCSIGIVKRLCTICKQLYL